MRTAASRRRAVRVQPAAPDLGRPECPPPGARRLRPLCSVAVGAALVCLALPTLASSPALASPIGSSLAQMTGGSPASAVGPALVPAVTSCGLPVVHDQYDGFHIGVPSGWDVSTLDGQIAVNQNASGTVGALLYPALLTKGLSAAGLFSSWMSYEKSLISKSGGTLSSEVRSGPGGLPSATITITTSSSQLVGTTKVFVLPLATQVGTKEGVFFADWAPKAQFASDAGTLAAIGNCYGPERAELFRVFQDQAFTYILPPGWVVFGEGSDAIDLHGFNNDADVSYLFWGPLEAGVNSSVAITSPQSAINYIFGKIGMAVTSVISTYVLPNQQLSSSVQGQEYMEFTGRSEGKAVHGIVYMETDIGSGVASGTMRLGVATTNLWNSVNGGLIEMMGAISHSLSVVIGEINHANQEWQNFSGQVANFDDALNSQQLVQDPTNGQLYEAPYDSYIVDGADGPGYYLPNGQRLNAVERQ